MENQEVVTIISDETPAPVAVTATEKPSALRNTKFFNQDQLKRRDAILNYFRTLSGVSEADQMRYTAGHLHRNEINIAMNVLYPPKNAGTQTANPPEITKNEAMFLRDENGNRVRGLYALMNAELDPNPPTYKVPKALKAPVAEGEKRRPGRPKKNVEVTIENLPEIKSQEIILDPAISAMLQQQQQEIDQLLATAEEVVVPVVETPTPAKKKSSSKKSKKSETPTTETIEVV